MVTDVTELKLVPVMVTRFPTCSRTGVKEVIVGAGKNVKATDWVDVPPGVVTTTFPVVPDPTTAVICVALLTTNEVTAVPPRVTADAFVKPVPVMTRFCPVPVVVGEILLTFGTAFLTIKNLSEVPIRPFNPRTVISFAPTSRLL